MMINLILLFGGLLLLNLTCKKIRFLKLTKVNSLKIAINGKDAIKKYLPLLTKIITLLEPN